MNEKGQAIIEFTVSIVAIMAVFLGVIFAFALGKGNVDNIIQCRGKADDYAGNGVPGEYGSTIVTWSAGLDGKMFTNDDVPVTGYVDDAALFTGELSNGSIDLVSGFSGDYVQNNFAEDMDEMYSIYLSMANMTSSSIVSDPYDNQICEDLRNAFESIIYDSELSIDNTVYMPIFFIQED